VIKTAAILFGIVFLLIGILGFVPAATPANGMLLGIFHVNTAHNFVHLASGVVFLLCGMLASAHHAPFSESSESFMRWSPFLVFIIGITRSSD
jgi:heme/copper-type cytochrome/quinol oxidase subunit 3